MDMMEFLRTRRSFRRFEQRPVPAALTENILEAARLASSSANRQPLKYAVAQSPAGVAAVSGLLKWAAALPPELGTPKPEERPTLYVVVLKDTSINPNCDTDAGLAIANMTAAAWAEGVGSCILASVDRPKLAALLELPETCVIHTVVAFGYPAHKSTVVDMREGSVKYYLDEDRNYYVPKRSLSEIVLKRL